jgi:tRNA A37 threonylcarbamoyladenosine dehydratase
MKADTAAARVHDINPECKVEAIRDFIDADTAGRILSEPPDVLIDAIDSLNPKTALLKIAADCGTRTIVSSMGAAQRTDPLAVRVDDISQTFNCPLARLMRKRLRRLGVHQGIRCVYSIEKPVGRRIRVDEAEDDFLQRGRKRETLGSFVCLTGIFGLVAAREAIQSIVGSPAGAALGNPMPTSL